MSNTKKTMVKGAAFLASLLMTTTAYGATSAPNNWYLGVSGDGTWIRHDDFGGGGNVDLGYRFGDIRLEGEAGYHDADSTHYFSYMGNVYYDFNSLMPTNSSGWHVVPYIGGGIGDAAVHYGNDGTAFSSTFKHHENSFAYQGMAGLTLTSASAPSVDWSLGYRYFGTDKRDLHANNIELGARFHF
jgi:opacity protein-like surface antigen